MRPAVILGVMRMRGGAAIARAILDAADADIIALEPVNHVLRGAGIPHIEFQSLLTREIVERGQEQVVPRAEAIMRAVNDPALRAAYPLFDGPVWRGVADQISEFVRGHLIPTIAIVETLREIAKRWRLQLVILSEDALRDSRTLAVKARRLGVPSLQIQHGIPTGSLITHTGVHTTHVAAFSEASKRMFVDLGADPARTFVTGNPAWDPYLQPVDAAQCKAVCHRHGLDPDRPVLTYAFTQPSTWTLLNAQYPRHHIDLSEAVCRAMKTVAERHPDWQFLLRPRQRDDEIARARAMVEAARAGGIQHIHVDLSPVEDCIVFSDVMLCTQSNIGIEALCRGKAVINVDIEEFGAAVYREGIGPLFRDGDAVLQADSEAAIAGQMEAAVLDESVRAMLRDRRSATIERFNGFTGGESTARVVRIALQLMNAGRDAVPPVDRYPDVEPAIVGAVPADARDIVVVGRAAPAVVRLLAHTHPRARCSTAIKPNGPFPADTCVVLADPVSPFTDGAQRVTALRDAMAGGARLVAWFRSGDRPEAWETLASGVWPAPDPDFDRPTALGEFSEPGVRAALSRSDFAVDTITPYGWHDDTMPGTPPCLGWVAVARAGGPLRPGPYADEKARAARRAELRNRAGEDLFAQGRLEDATRAFQQALESHPAAIYANNLGVVQHALGHHEPAWDAFRTALHHDPYHAEARANLMQLAGELGRTAEVEALFALYPA